MGWREDSVADDRDDFTVFDDDDTKRPADTAIHSVNCGFHRHLHVRVHGVFWFLCEI